MPKQVILGKQHRDAIREYYKSNGECAKVIQRINITDTYFMAHCRVKDEQGDDCATLVMFNYDSHGNLYASEYDHSCIENEQSMIDGLINCEDCYDGYDPNDEEVYL